MLNQRLKELRKKHKITQKQFSEIFNISKGTIAMWETNKREPDLRMLKTIAKYFKCTTDYLLGLSDATFEAKKEYGADNQLTPTQKENIDLMLQLHDLQQIELKGRLLRLLEEKTLLEEKGIY